MSSNSSFFFFFRQNTSYEVLISDWSSDVCSSDLIDKNGKFVDDLISCRKGGEYIMAMKDSIDFIDVSPKQLVSVAAALIPFRSEERRVGKEGVSTCRYRCAPDL